MIEYLSFKGSLMNTMRKSSIILYFLMANNCLFGQSNDSDCYEFMYFENNENFTDTTFLSNGAMLYTQWNCDSTWITFENESRVIIQSCKVFDPILCSRLGLSVIKEYPSYLFFISNHISGCCDPPDLLFMDKEKCVEFKSISSPLFVWGDADKDYAIYFSDSTYTTLLFLDLLTLKTSSYKFKKGKVSKSIKKNNVMFKTEIFKNFKKAEEIFSLDFTNKNGKVEIISFNTR